MQEVCTTVVTRASSSIFDPLILGTNGQRHSNQMEIWTYPKKLWELIRPADLQLQPPKTPSMKLRQSWQKLCKIRKQAAQKRKQFLNDLLVTAKRTKNKARSNLIYGLKQAEENHHCFMLVQQALKPQWGGLTHILVPSNNDEQQWNTVTDVAAMENQLLQQGKQHFQKAKGTPYTQEPLKTLLGTNSLTNFGDSIHRGHPIDPELPIDPTTWLLLEHQQNAIPTLINHTHPMPFEAVIQGFKKWPEKTSTLPSGCHLGIYKTLLKDQHHEQPGKLVTTNWHWSHAGHSPTISPCNQAHAHLHQVANYLECIHWKRPRQTMHKSITNSSLTWSGFKLNTEVALVQGIHAMSRAEQ